MDNYDTCIPTSEVYPYVITSYLIRGQGASSALILSEPRSPEQGTLHKAARPNTAKDDI
jgi:hypothetical protein